ncbi:MAG: hypothetical protein ACP6IY_04255 [Promethearchaeia archaeon]
MRKKFIAIFLLLNLSILVNLSIISNAEDEKRPDWVLDPDEQKEFLEDFELYDEESSTYEDPIYKKKVDVWWQIWLSPKGCTDAPPCTAIFGIAYFESEEPITQEDLDDFKDTIESLNVEIEDVTDDVANAAYAIVYKMTVTNASLYFGFVIFNTMKNYLLVVQVDLQLSSGDDLNIKPAADIGNKVQDLLVATGEAAKILAIPGYDLMLIVGIIGVISTILILKKKY